MRTTIQFFHRFDNWLEHNRAYRALRAWVIRQGIALRIWTNHRLHEARHCRECRSDVNPFERVCPACGASSPARVSQSAGVAVVGVTLVVLVVAFLLG